MRAHARSTACTQASEGAPRSPRVPKCRSYNAIALSAATPLRAKDGETLTVARGDQRDAVREAYAATARGSEACCVATPSAKSRADIGYSAAEMEFGRDPRRAPPWITENRELLEELEASSKPTKKGMSSASPRVSSLLTLSDFEAALAHAVAAERDAALTSDKSHAAVSLVGRRRRFVAIKFYSTSCRACGSVGVPPDPLGWSPGKGGAAVASAPAPQAAGEAEAAAVPAAVLLGTVTVGSG